MSRDRPNDTTHRDIAQRKLGRPLAANEVAHHIDGDPAHNNAANIEVKTRSAHSTDHGRTRNLAKVQKALRMMRERRKLY